MGNGELNLFKVLYEHGASENEVTQALSYFLRADRVFLDAFVAKIDESFHLVEPKIGTQKELEEGVPDLRIVDDKARIRILVEVKLDAPETGGDQLKRYLKSLEKFSKERSGWKTSLILLSKRRMSELSAECRELLWYDVYEILKNLKEKSELEEDFIELMEVSGLAKKPIRFEGIDENDINALQKFGSISEGLKELKSVLIEKLEDKLKVMSYWRVKTRGVELLKAGGNGYIVYIDVYWSPAMPTPDEYDKLMGVDSPCFFVNIAFTISTNQKLKKTLINRGFFAGERYSPFIQKAFKIKSQGREKQIAEILKIVRENVPELG